MLSETGKVVRFDGDAVWIQTIRHSVCGSCQARMGCGQNLLNQLVGATAEIKVDLTGQVDKIKEGDIIEIGIEEGAIVAASLLAYGVPLFALVLAVVLADNMQLSVVGVLLACGLGLLAGISISRVFLASRFRSDFFEPTFIRKVSVSH